MCSDNSNINCTEINISWEIYIYSKMYYVHKIITILRQYTFVYLIDDWRIVVTTTTHVNWSGQVWNCLFKSIKETKYVEYRESISENC